MPTSGHDDTGRSIKSWPVNCTTTGSFQPLNYTDNYKPYGITDKTSNAFYCKDMIFMKKYYLPKGDPNQFNVTCRVGFNGKQYIINSILPFPKHMDIYLELVL